MKRALVLVMAVVAVLFVVGCGDSGTSSDASPEAAKKWTKVTTLKGTSSKKSEAIALQGGEQRLDYTVKGTTMPTVLVYVEEADVDIMEDGGFPVVTIDKAGKDSTMMTKDAGDYRFTVEAANASWTLVLYEMR